MSTVPLGPLKLATPIAADEYQEWCNVGIRSADITAEYCNFGTGPEVGLAPLLARILPGLS
jgi:hypothetical protein